MKVFKFFNTNTSSKDADTFAPSCSSAKNNTIIMDTVVAVSILLFAAIIISLISDLLLNIIIASGLLLGLIFGPKKQAINLLPARG